MTDQDTRPDALEIILADGSTLPIESVNLDRIDEAMTILLKHIEDIQSQLNSPNVTGTDGRRLTSYEWGEWRQAAKQEWRQKLDIYRALKGRRIQLHREGRIAASKIATEMRITNAELRATLADLESASDPDILLRALYGMTVELLRDLDVTVRPKEQTILDVCSTYLNKISPRARILRMS